ncbi:MAG: hypothetical protein Q4D38_00385 [Planctomycetia bacterium]|nr:hypothetical protein [Planctomycetia bacterium]
MKSIQFLHAADFQWQVPVMSCATAASGGGLYPPVPEEISRILREAPWESARRVFDVALERKVDFLLLTGDILEEETCGPRGIAFLTGQMERLREAGIPIYWKWRETLEWNDWPENVFILPPGETQVRKFRLAEETGTVFLVSWEGEKPDFARYDLSKLPGEKLPFSQTLGLRDAPFSEENAGERVGAYVALGENEPRQTRVWENATFHHPGTIQGRTADVFREGSYPTFGVSLVKMDLEGKSPLSIQLIPTETVAWQRTRLEVPVEIESAEGLAGWLEEQLALHGKGVASGVEKILRVWKLTSQNPTLQTVLRQIFLENLCPMGWNQERVGEVLLNRLRRVGETYSPGIWSVSLEVEERDLIPAEWSRSESMLGDFLRLVQFHQNNPDADGGEDFVSHTLDLDSFLSKTQLEEELQVVSRISEPLVFQEVLRQTAILGADALHRLREEES